MSGLRETLDDLETAVDAPTRFKTEGNTCELRCAGCGELFYVDEHTFNRAQSALEFDPADTPFCCDDCEEQYEEEAMR
jgi:NAD-dependent SIR2 family protein deacetylase